MHIFKHLILASTLLASAFASHASCRPVGPENNSSTSRDVQINPDQALDIIIQCDKTNWTLRRNSNSARAHAAVSHGGQIVYIANEPLSDAEVKQLRRKEASRLFSSAAPNAVNGSNINPLTIGDEFDPDWQLIDMGWWGIWEPGPYMENSYFWSDVVFSDSMDLYLTKSQLQQCKLEATTCFNISDYLYSQLVEQCGYIPVNSWMQACFVGAKNVSDLVIGQCWDTYIKCVFGRAPNIRTDKSNAAGRTHTPKQAYAVLPRRPLSS